ncbi:MAG: hypothetical protein WC511_07870 [Candidatus Pacearchaeota archaeon]
MANELTTFSQKDIDESQAIAGQSKFTKMPFVPIVSVNNKKEKKIANIDGVDQEVEVPAKKGFLMLEKNEESGEVEEKFIGGEITGVILKERYMIEKKYIEGEMVYRSDEFEGWNNIIQLYEKKDRKNIIFEGKYSAIKEAYTRTDDKGKKSKDFDLYLILYVNLEMTGTIVRVKLKMTGDNNWFDYKSEFGDNEPWAGFVTHFNLVEKKVGTNTYWHILLEKGQAINLSEQLVLQKELNKFFNFTSPKKKSDALDGTWQGNIANTEVQPFNQEELPILQVEDEPAGDDIDIGDIPF